MQANTADFDHRSSATSAGQGAQNPRFGTGRDKAGFGRFREDALIAGAGVSRVKDAQLPLPLGQGA